MQYVCSEQAKAAPLSPGNSSSADSSAADSSAQGMSDADIQAAAEEEVCVLFQRLSNGCISSIHCDQSVLSFAYNMWMYISARTVSTSVASVHSAIALPAELQHTALTSLYKPLYHTQH
jgi:hypothetical protein